MQNEPEDGKFPGFPFNSMGWNTQTALTFITENWGPTLFDNGYDDLKLMIMDDQRVLAPRWGREVRDLNHL